jgi:hypothetical protein
MIIIEKKVATWTESAIPPVEELGIKYAETYRIDLCGIL